MLSLDDAWLTEKHWFMSLESHRWPVIGPRFLLLELRFILYILSMTSQDTACLIQAVANLHRAIEGVPLAYCDQP